VYRVQLAVFTALVSWFFQGLLSQWLQIFLIEQAGLRAPGVGVDHRLGVVLEGIDAGASQNQWIADQVTEDE